MNSKRHAPRPNLSKTLSIRPPNCTYIASKNEKCTKSLYADSMQNMTKKLQKRKLRPHLHIKTV